MNFDIDKIINKVRGEIEEEDREEVRQKDFADRANRIVAFVMEELRSPSTTPKEIASAQKRLYAHLQGLSIDDAYEVRQLAREKLSKASSLGLSESGSIRKLLS